MTATIQGAASTVVAKHARWDHHAGNGYTEPREAWIECSCGALVWQWQQFYFETGENPNVNWAEHLIAMTTGQLTADLMRHWTDRHWDSCPLPQHEDDWGDFF